MASFWNRLQKEKSLRDPFGISCLNLLAACCAIICSSVIYLTPSILYVNTTSTHPAGREVDTVLSPQDVRLSSLSSGRWTQPLVLTKAVQSVSNGWLCSYWNRHNTQATCMIIFAFRLHHYFIGLCIYSRGGVYIHFRLFELCLGIKSTIWLKKTIKTPRKLVQISLNWSQLCSFWLHTWKATQQYQE